MWRERQGYPCGEHRGLALGSRLAMPQAREGLWNFLTEDVRDLVRREVQDPGNRRGKLYVEPRLYDDLLSSQPLCFNLFGPLRLDLPLATAVFRALTGGRVHAVTGIAFEHSPGRGDAQYTGDRSAFDVFVSYATASGGRGFVGVEVKYHEDLLGRAAGHRSRYDEVASCMGCFATDLPHDLRLQPLQQLWRDHLLAGAVRQVDGFDDGFFLVLYPERNVACADAVRAYRECLSSEASFAALTLETLVGQVRRHTGDAWVARFHDRYLDFGKVDAGVSCGPADASQAGGQGRVGRVGQP